MKVTLLGTGTSTGVPAIGCSCSVCLSSHHRNRRTRPFGVVENDRFALVINTSPDFRGQALRQGIRRLDAILFASHHADHLLGLDDIRPLNFYQQSAIPCYGSAETIREVRITFRHSFADNYYGGLRQIITHVIDGPAALEGRLVRGTAKGARLGFPTRNGILNAPPSTRVWKATGTSSRRALPISTSRTMVPCGLWSRKPSSGFSNAVASALAWLGFAVGTVFMSLPKRKFL